MGAVSTCISQVEILAIVKGLTNEETVFKAFTGVLVGLLGIV
jgi:hypothetical protein